MVYVRSLALGAFALASVSSAVPMGKAQSSAGALVARGNEQCGCTVTVTVTAGHATSTAKAKTTTAKSVSKAKTTTTKAKTTTTKSKAATTVKSSSKTVTTKAHTTAAATTKSATHTSSTAKTSASSTGSKGTKDCNASATSAFSSCSTKITSITAQIKELCTVESSTSGASFSLTGELGALVGGLIGGSFGAEIEAGASIDASTQVKAIEKLLAEVTTEVAGVVSTIGGLEGYAEVSGGVSVTTVGHAAAVFTTDLNALYALRKYFISFFFLSGLVLTICLPPQLTPTPRSRASPALPHRSRRPQTQRFTPASHRSTLSSLVLPRSRLRSSAG